jgi:hypothetical protein
MATTAMIVVSTDIGEDDEWVELDCSWGSDAGKPAQRKGKPVDDHDGELQLASHSVFLTHNTGTWSCPDVAVRTNSSITVPRPPASDDAIGEACRSAISAEGAACGSTIGCSNTSRMSVGIACGSAIHAIKL